MNQEYFTVELTSKINLGLPLADMKMVAQFEQQNICLVPGVAKFWYGVANFKGSLLWLLDSDRFFNLDTRKDELNQKFTAVVLHSQQSGAQKKVALVTQQLKGIVSIKPTDIQPLAVDISPQLRRCCSDVAQIESQTFYLIDSTALLKQLHQQSMLLSA